MRSNKKYVLVTGGAGYIGSHVYVALKDLDFEPIILDNFSNCHASVINNLSKITGKKVYYRSGDIRNTKLIKNILKKYEITDIIHLAAHKSIEEATLYPKKYLLENTSFLISLLNAIKELKSCNFIFSSSANTYQNSNNSILFESDKLNSNNAYGKSKIYCENIIKGIFKRKKNFNYSILRYFNPAGAHESCLIGQNEKSKYINLFSKIDNVALKKEKKLNIYGNNYKTLDRTCIRDYFHVMDLAEGHVKSLNYIKENNKNLIMNLGSGIGISVLEVVRNYEKFNNLKIPLSITKPRNNDLPEVVPSIALAKKLIHWKPKYSIKEICESSYKFKLNLY